MAVKQGQFVWYEMMAPEVPAALRFYQSVIGWGARDAGLADRGYTVLLAGEAPVGGLMETPEAARADGARPGWLGYVAVGDVDGFAARFRQAGGTVHREAEDIPGVGRFAVVADPQGAVLVLFRGTGEAPPTAAANTPGRVGWHELQTTDPAASLAFYSGMFGWTKAETMDMGAMGTYQIFAIDGVGAGGMMTRQPGVPASFWQYYFIVPAIGAAMARVKDAGGQVINGPHQVPGGSWIVNCLDPHGAIFSLVAPAE